MVQDDSSILHLFCILYFYYYYFNSTPDHQALDTRVWGPLGGIGGRRRRGRQRMRWLDGITWLDGRESEWILGVGDGQRGLACCNSWGHKESDTTERLNWTELNWYRVSVELLLTIRYKYNIMILNEGCSLPVVIWLRSHLTTTGQGDMWVHLSELCHAKCYTQ